MKAFDRLLEEDIAAYEGRHDDLIYQAPAFYRLLVNLLDDPRLPGRLRPLVLAAVAYFILPADIIPEGIHGPYGYVDDIYLCAWVANRVLDEVGSEELLESNWDGEAPLIPLLTDILERAQELVGDQEGRILRYIGYEHLVEPFEQEQPEWDQQRANSRSTETMRRIALDALGFQDDDGRFYSYAAEHGLTVNEVVYYLNAYEAGGDAGLRALVAPDILPPAVARHALRTIEKALRERFPGDDFYRLTDEGTAIGVYQIQKRWQTQERYLFPVCQFRRSGNKWHLYWMHKFDAWWPYPLPEKGRKFTLQARLQQLLDDEYGCFWV